MAGNTYKTVDEGGAGLPAPRASRGRLLALCYGVVICTAIALTADGPLLPTMVTQFGGVSPTEAGAWIGLIQGSYVTALLLPRLPLSPRGAATAVSTIPLLTLLLHDQLTHPASLRYYLAQIFVAPVMGYLSDVFGRKPIMLYGCVAWCSTASATNMPACWCR